MHSGNGQAVKIFENYVVDLSNVIISECCYGVKTSRTKLLSFAVHFNVNTKAHIYVYTAIFSLFLLRFPFTCTVFRMSRFDFA